MHRRNFFLSSAASLLGAAAGFARRRLYPVISAHRRRNPVSARETPGGDPAVNRSTSFSKPVPVRGSWQLLTPGPKVDFGFDPLHFETTFWELRPGRLAPINTKTAVGLPGWPVMGFGYLMRARYSEFQMRFSIQDAGRELRPYTLAHFRQFSPGSWLPGAISEWDHGGVRYRVSYIVAPNDPQPLDLYHISLQNTGPAKAKAKLLVTLDGATSLRAAGDLIADRGKPLVVMDPKVRVERHERACGCVDPRATPSGNWVYPSMKIDSWRTHRDGWYGMPIEYLFRVKPGERLKVFLGFGGTPQPYTANWDIPLSNEFPEIAGAYRASLREVVATVEGDPAPRQIKLDINKKAVLGFTGEDRDGDGYIKVAVRATAASRQPAVLAMLWAFETGSPVTAGELLDREEQLKPRYRIDVGDDMPWDIRREAEHLGNDPTAAALRLHYDPVLAPGEEKTYLLRLPAIDKPEMAPYGNPWRPYDTATSWMPYMGARHAENKTPYGEDVPPGADPAEYAIFGPKPRELWARQLAAARQTTWQSAFDRLNRYWNGFVGRGARFLVPEPYLEYLYKHQLAILRIHQIKAAGYAVQLTGPDWYWDLALSRDCPYMCLAWDLAGFHDISQSLLQTLLTPLKNLPRMRWTLGQWGPGVEPYRYTVGAPPEPIETDGLWVARTGQWDGQGQILWALNTHYRLTGNREWLRANYPKIARGGDWILRAIAEEKRRLGNPQAIGYGLLPPGTGESGGSGHNYYLNSFAVLGLHHTARSSQTLGRHEAAERFRQHAAELNEALHKAMREGFFRFNDFAGSLAVAPEWHPAPQSFLAHGKRRISKSLPTSDFGCPLVLPTEAAAPFDPMMNAWFRYREYQAQSTGGLFDWPYIAVDMGISYLRRGEPDRAADWFYAYADHAAGTLDWGENVEIGSTFAEFIPPRKGIRTEGQMPHGWASAMYVRYLRHLLVHEEGEDLHLAPATPRPWLAQPRPIGVEGVPSEFGPVTFHLAADPDRTTIRGDVRMDLQRPPRRLLLHVRAPGGGGLKAVTVNGKRWQAFHRDTVIIPNPPARIQIEAQTA